MRQNFLKTSKSTTLTSIYAREARHPTVSHVQACATSEPFSGDEQGIQKTQGFIKFKPQDFLHSS